MNFIETYKVDHDICDKIVDIFWKYKNHHVAGKSGDGGVHKEIKDSIDLYISDKSLHRLGGFKPILIDYITKYFNNYIIKEQGWQVEIDEPINIQYYKPNMGYPQPHFERTQYANRNRALVWMLYLTDTPNGGTHFIYQKHTTECVKGDLIVWPPDFTHTHHGVISKTHDKMIVTGWIHWANNGSS